jgi:hypothetical protein
MSEPNYDEIDPGVREAVRLLRSFGFETTDSGDGTHKATLGWEPETFVPYPHVMIRVAPGQLEFECRRLRSYLTSAGVTVVPSGHGNPDGEHDVSIQGLFDPADESGVIVVEGISDELLRRERR